jgi:F-type H+-transporting ATPase subunit b
MHIDLFVFFAQIVNLFILMFLLKKFLFGKIIGAMDAREAKIGAVFAEAEASRQGAEKSAETYDQKLRDLEVRYEEMLNQARQDAETHRNQLMAKAREEVDFLQKRWVEALRSERQHFLQELRHLAGNQIYAVSRRVLKDLADLDLEERIVEVLVERIATMDEQEKIKFSTPIAAGGMITVACAFEIPEASRSRLSDALKKRLTGEFDVAYEHSDDILSGCELRSNGHKIAWSMKDYLDSLEERFYSALYEEVQERT